MRHLAYNAIGMMSYIPNRVQFIIHVLLRGNMEFRY
jgi:hypothetical protein